MMSKTSSSWKMMVRASLVSWKMQTLSSSLSFAVFETFSTNFTSKSKRLKWTQYKKLGPNALRFLIWNLANNMKKHDKYRQNVRSIGEKLKIRVLCSLLHFFHMICKISNLNMLAAKHLAQSSRTELILLNLMMQSYISQELQKN